MNTVCVVGNRLWSTGEEKKIKRSLSWIKIWNGRGKLVQHTNIDSGVVSLVYDKKNRRIWGALKDKESISVWNEVCEKQLT